MICSISKSTGYKTLGFSQQNAVGTDPFGAPGLLGGVAPYWRAALEPHWGRNSLMVGTFGMYVGSASVGRHELRDLFDRRFR